MTQRILAWLLAFAVLPLIADGRTAAAQRPAAPRLLPEKTLVYFRVGDANALRDGVQRSSVGRLLEDDQLRPLMGDLYGGGARLFEQISDRVGVSLDELLSIPQGELAIAVVPLETSQGEEQQETGPKDESPEAIRERIESRRNRRPLGLIGMMETGERTRLMMRIVEQMEDRLGRDGYVRSQRTVAGAEVVTFTRGGALPIAYAERDSVVVLAIGPHLVDDLLRRWDGGSNGATLAQNVDFGNVMSHCVGAEASQPQVTFYADPYHLLERISSAVGGRVGAAWTILQSLDFDKLKGIGGSLFLGGEEGFESIAHLHLLLDSPRDGMLSVVRPGEGSVQPEPWVPADIVSYTTLHWNVDQAYRGLDRILSRFMGDDAAERIIETRINNRIGLDFRSDIIEQLSGRIGIIRWNEPPSRINSLTRTWAVQFKDAAAAQTVLDGVSETFAGSLREERIGGTTVYLGGRAQRGEDSAQLRRVEPAMAIFGDYIIASDSRKAIEHLIRARGGSVPTLGLSPDYDLIAGEISGKLGSDMPFLFSFVRREEVFRQIYELAQDPASRQFLRRAGENNAVAKMLVDALEKNQLPAFSAFAKYFAPSGAFAYDDPTGLHYAAFTLKPIH